MCAKSVQASMPRYPVIGPTYPIIETDFIEAMQEKWQQWVVSGKAERLRQRMVDTVIQYADRPRPVKGVTPTQTPSDRFIDPSITLSQSIVDETGRVLVPQGTRVNPLESVTLNERLLFFDGDNAEQVTWAKRESQQLKPAKLILIKGSLSKISEALKQPLYFDQGGRLARFFKFAHTPAIVEQTGLRLHVREVLA